MWMSSTHERSYTEDDTTESYKSLRNASSAEYNTKSVSDNSSLVDELTYYSTQSITKKKPTKWKKKL